MKMKWEVCNSLVHNTAKSGFARVNFKIKFTSEKRKAVTLTTYSSTQVFFIFSKDERLQGNLLTQRITTLIWSLCEQSVQRTPVYLLRGANKKKLYWDDESLIWVLKLYIQRCLQKSLIAWPAQTLGMPCISQTSGKVPLRCLKLLAIGRAWLLRFAQLKCWVCSSCLIEFKTYRWDPITPSWTTAVKTSQVKFINKIFFCHLKIPDMLNFMNILAT